MWTATLHGITLMNLWLYTVCFIVSQHILWQQKKFLLLYDKFWNELLFSFKSMTLLDQNKNRKKKDDASDPLLVVLVVFSSYKSNETKLPQAYVQGGNVNTFTRKLNLWISPNLATFSKESPQFCQERFGNYEIKWRACHSLHRLNLIFKDPCQGRKNCQG